ncbi:MAG: hypothetical protein AAGI13_06275 [Pseudomonadota bacterium]
MKLFIAPALLIAPLIFPLTALPVQAEPLSQRLQALTEAAAGQPAQYSPPAAKEGHSYPDCYCTDSAGDRVEIGASACLQIGSRQVWARCGMSLNNPAWRHSGESCPSA